MSDYIKREDAYSACCYETPECYMARKEIKALPSADVAPVVRCKDCRWRDAEEKHHCIDINRVFDQMDFCSFGERKDDETI